MLLPPSGYKPPRVKLPSAFFKPYPFRLALARGQDGSLTAREGFDAFEVVTNAGETALFIPALNFFEAVRKGSLGDSTVFSDIDLISSDSSLFDLPSGAATTVGSRPSGIVWQ